MGLPSDRLVEPVSTATIPPSVSWRVFCSALGAVVAALALAACGGGRTHSAAPVIRAADITAGAPGYRLAGSATITGARAGAVQMTMSGVYDRRDRLGRLSTVLHVAGEQVHISELVSKLTVYMGSDAIPNGTQLAGGKPWLKISMSRAMGAAGFGSLPTTTDPSQYVDYLRAVSTSTTKVGTAAVRGIPTTHYHAIVDLNRYPDLVPAAQRKAVSSSVKNLEAALGGHTMPLDVWIDGHHLVRRLGLHFAECVSGAHFQFNMTADLYDYGPQSRPRTPPASQVYDLTRALQATLRHVKLRCTH